MKHIHNLAQTGTSKIVFKYTADDIRLFFMCNDFLIITFERKARKAGAGVVK
jgi:hypothetical protein